MAKKSIKTINNFSESNSTTVKTNSVGTNIAGIATIPGGDNSLRVVATNLNGNGLEFTSPLWGDFSLVDEHNSYINMYTNITYVVIGSGNNNIYYINPNIGNRIGSRIVLISKDGALLKVFPNISGNDNTIIYVDSSGNTKTIEGYTDSFVVGSNNQTGQVGASVTLTCLDDHYFVVTSYTGAYIGEP